MAIFLFLSLILFPNPISQFNILRSFRGNQYDTVNPIPGSHFHPKKIDFFYLLFPCRHKLIGKKRNVRSYAPAYSSQGPSVRPFVADIHSMHRILNDVICNFVSDHFFPTPYRSALNDMRHVCFAYQIFV